MFSRWFCSFCWFITNVFWPQFHLGKEKIVQPWNLGCFFQNLCFLQFPFKFKFAKLTLSPLKNGDWRISLSYWVSVTFQGLLLLNFRRVKATKLMLIKRRWRYTSGQIIIFHQPGFPWNKAIYGRVPYHPTIWGKSIVWGRYILTRYIAKGWPAKLFDRIISTGFTFEISRRFVLSGVVFV